MNKEKEPVENERIFRMKIISLLQPNLDPDQWTEQWISGRIAVAQTNSPTEGP